MRRDSWKHGRRAPLDPDIVFQEIAEVLGPYGVGEIDCDAWAIDPLRSCARRASLVLREHPLTAEQKVESYRSVETLLRTKRLELPPHDVLTSDLRSVRRKALANAVRVDLPRTADGRHADFSPSVALAVWLSMQNETPEWIRAMGRFDREGRRGQDAFPVEPSPREYLPIQRLVGVHGGLSLEIDHPGFRRMEATYTRGARHVTFSQNASPEFQRRVNSWWSQMTFDKQGAW